VQFREKGGQFAGEKLFEEEIDTAKKRGDEIYRPTRAA
jgi:hypothetical protein